jgi:hypothetical protein
MPVLRFPGSPTLKRYAASEAPVCIIQGPIESGKSVGSVGRLFKQALQMPRCIDGVRRVKTVIWRQTYPQLLGSTMQTWLQWFPEKVYGKIAGSEPYIHQIRFLDLEWDVYFQAFPDYTPKVVADLKSTEWTNAWANEMQFASRELFVEVLGRTGRFPRKDDCPKYDRKPRQCGDLNAPHVHDHWVLHMRGETPIPSDMPEDDKQALIKPAGWEFFVQPPAIKEVTTEEGKLIRYEINPKAENLNNMGEGRYLELTAGRTRSEVKRDLGNKVVPMQKGKPRYPDFDRDWHVAKEEIPSSPEHPIILGFDFGGSPACIFEQKIDGRWYTLDELNGDNEGADEFAPRVLAKLNERFPFYREKGLIAWGDPQGAWGASNSMKKENTSFAIFGSYGIAIKAPADKDQPELRLNTGRRLIKDTVNRGPKILIDPRCVRLIAALDGGCTMKETRINGGLEVSTEIVKDKHSHPVEAWEYPKWGGGEARDLIRSPAKGPAKPVVTFGKKSVFLSRRYKR